MWYVNRFLLEANYLNAAISPPKEYLPLFDYKFKRIVKEILGYSEQKVLET